MFASLIFVILAPNFISPADDASAGSMFSLPAMAKMQCRCCLPARLVKMESAVPAIDLDLHAVVCDA